MTTGRYPTCPTRTTDRMPAISRRGCADYTTLAERIAEREGEQARVAALNREMQRQWRSEWTMGYWINWAVIVTIYLAAAVAITLTWGME